MLVTWREYNTPGRDFTTAVEMHLDVESETMPFRTERDPLGEREVPADAYYGIQTAARRRELPHQRPARARRSGHRHDPRQEGGRRSEPRRSAGCRATSRRRSSQAADEVLAGRLRDQFVVDVYQAGAGTSHNMNANEVLANRAAEILGEPRGAYDVVHPNDHVNMGQSTNDVFPTATRLALLARRSTRSLAAARGAGGRVRPRRPTTFARRAEGRPHAPAGRRADDARAGVRRLRGLPRRGRRRGGSAPPNSCGS